MALAREFRLQVLLGEASYPEELASVAQIRICPMGRIRYLGRLTYFVWAFVCVARSRFRSRPMGSKAGQLLFVTTYQPICLLVGALAQRLLKVKWVADVFDVPALGLEIIEHDNKSAISWVCSIPRRVSTYAAYRLLKHADLVLCTLVPDALTQCSVPARKIIALTNGIELNDYPAPNTPEPKCAGVFEVLYVGAVLRVRGLETMLDACHLLRGRVPGLRLGLVGPSTPDERDWLDRRVAMLDLATTVSITGELPHEEVLRRVHDADLCLFPFFRTYATEFIYPVKILEYIAAGRPVIASDLAGVRRIIENGRSGILVEPGNAQLLSDAIYLLWERPDLRESLAANARAAAPQFEWNRINGQMLQALSRLTEEPQ